MFVLCFIFVALFPFFPCQIELDTTVPPEVEEATVILEPVTEITTLLAILEVTDIPQSDIDDALFLEVGEYSTMSFQYVNDQFMNWQTRDSVYNCYEDFIKCTLSQKVLTHVCAINYEDYRYRGLKTLPSICDMYLDNCRRGYRFWHAMKFGACGYYNYRGELVFYQQG